MRSTIMQNRDFNVLSFKGLASHALVSEGCPAVPVVVKHWCDCRKTRAFFDGFPDSSPSLSKYA